MDDEPRTIASESKPRLDVGRFRSLAIGGLGMLMAGLALSHIEWMLRLSRDGHADETWRRLISVTNPLFLVLIMVLAIHCGFRASSGTPLQRGLVAAVTVAVTLALVFLVVLSYVIFFEYVYVYSDLFPG